MFVTFFDTCMVTLTAMVVWKLSPFIVFLPWLTIACLDGAFLSSALTKVPNGAWFTITLAIILASILLLWRFGKEQQWNAEAEDRFPTTHFVRIGDEGDLYLTDKYDGTLLSTNKGLGIFFDKAGETTPIVFSQFLLKLSATFEVMIFFHLRPLEVPSVSADERYTVSRLAVPHCYRLVVRYGYNDVVISPDLALIIKEKVREYIEEDFNRSKSPSAGDTDEKERFGSSGLESARLDAAYAHKVLYVMGKEQMKIKEHSNPFRAVLLWAFLWLRENTRTKMASLKIPADRMVEVGFIKEI